MSKITFRADDDLVKEIEAFDASKSEVLREALRSYIENHETEETTPDADSLDTLVADRVDELIDQRLNDRLGYQSTPQDVTVNVSIEDERTTPERKTESSENATVEPDDRACTQCGETVGDEHVYCPNCGEKASKRSFCECGDELRSDWAFCPTCGRRTPAADVLDPR